ncbi:MAG: tetratricopeptide repeat-containing sensor histidine kinase [Bacteroidia bacterium]
MYRRITALFNKNDDSQNVERICKEWLLFAESKKDKKQIVKSMTLLSNAYRNQSKYEQLLSITYKGIAFAENERDSILLVDFMSTLGGYYNDSKEVDKALALHLKCLEMSRKINYGFGISSNLVDVGSDYIALNQQAKSVPYYLENLSYVYLFPNTVYELQTYNSAATAYSYIGQYDSAYYYSNKAYELGLKLEMNEAIASAESTLAEIYYAMGKTDLAEKHALQALELSKKSDFFIQIPDLLKLLDKIYVGRGDYKSAYKIKSEFVMIQDSITNKDTRKKALEKEFAYNLEKKQNENKLLTQQNLIQSLKLNQNRYTILGAILLLFLVVLIAYTFAQRRKKNVIYKRVLLEQRLLRAQMNPHFIFNSLNSIQQLVMLGQNYPAEQYLGKFSKLIRSLLEHSIEDYISVKDEADMLHDYIQMESLRFKDSFSYKISIDEKIDTARFRIPHLMIQPFVENAIWHGLMPKANDRLVTIRFEYDSPKTIRCVVEDNGIGRVESKKNESVFKAKSLALSLIEQRLSLIRKTHNKNAHVVLTDLYNKEGKSEGTQVAIVLPIVYL